MSRKKSALRSEICRIDSLKTKGEYKPCPGCHKVTWKRTGLCITDKPMGKVMAQVMMCLDCAVYWGADIMRGALLRGGKDQVSVPCSKEKCKRRASISLKIRTTARPVFISVCHDHIPTAAAALSAIHATLKPVGRRAR